MMQWITFFQTCPTDIISNIVSFLDVNCPVVGLCSLSKQWNLLFWPCFGFCYRNVLFVMRDIAISNAALACIKYLFCPLTLCEPFALLPRLENIVKLCIELNNYRLRDLRCFSHLSHLRQLQIQFVAMRVDSFSIAYLPEHVQSLDLHFISSVISFIDFDFHPSLQSLSVTAERYSYVTQFSRFPINLLEFSWMVDLPSTDCKLSYYNGLKSVTNFSSDDSWLNVFLPIFPSLTTLENSCYPSTHFHAIEFPLSSVQHLKCVYEYPMEHIFFQHSMPYLKTLKVTLPNVDCLDVTNAPNLTSLIIKGSTCWNYAEIKSILTSKLLRITFINMSISNDLLLMLSSIPFLSFKQCALLEDVVACALQLKDVQRICQQTNRKYYDSERQYWHIVLQDYTEIEMPFPPKENKLTKSNCHYLSIPFKKQFWKKV